MKVLMISRDSRIFEQGSAVRQRMIEYGGLVEELHIIILSQTSNLKSQNFGNVYVYPTNSLSRWFYLFDAIKLGYRIAKEGENWLITTQDPFECGLLGYRIAKRFGLPLQLQIHTDFLSPYFWQESFLNKIRVWLARFLISKADCIRVVSERIKKSIVPSLKFQVSRIFVLPIFVDIEKIKNSPIRTDLHQKYPQFDFIILMASRLTKEKNIGLAIEALGNTNIGLIIVGNGPEEENLKFKIKNLKLTNNIIIEPWTDDLISYYKTADLFLLTSNYEGYGRVLVEAAVAGCKIVSTDVGIAREILEEENICQVGDKNDLKEKIEKAIRNEIKPARHLQFKAKGKYLEEYKKSWQLCAS